MQTDPQRMDHAAADSTIGSPAQRARTVVGGLLMGIANLIPGVSGGTMILAVGLYEEFIDAVADVTALRFRLRRIVFLALLLMAAGTSILLLSSVILFLLFRYSPWMFALFIGLTLGGAPLLVRMIGRMSAGVLVSSVCGIAVMAAVAVGGESGSMPRNTAMDVVSGVVGATTMVLPGISGSYMLLIMGQYDRVIGAIADLKSGAFGALWIIIPVGIGAVAGVVGLSHLLKWLLHRYERVTLGFLLGMLLGSVLGLWPFGRAPTEKILSAGGDVQIHAFADRHGLAANDALSGDELVSAVIEQWPNRTVSDYTTADIVGAVVMFFAGLVITILLGRLGGTAAATGNHV